MQMKTCFISMQHFKIQLIIMILFTEFSAGNCDVHQAVF